MIRHTYFRFFSCRMKTRKMEKHHVLYIPSFCFLFFDSIMENMNGVIKFPFPFFLIQKQKKGYRSMIRYTYFHFSFATSKKKIKKKQPLLPMPSFAFPFGVIHLGKEIRNQTILCSFSDSHLSDNINGICTRLVCSGFCVPYIKQWQKQKNICLIHAYFTA